MVSMNRFFDKYNRQTGAGNKLTELQMRIIDVLSRYKHARADVVGSSSGKGIEESSKYYIPNDSTVKYGCIGIYHFLLHYCKNCKDDYVLKIVEAHKHG